MNRTIKFSQNWNNKVACKSFTTIRLYNARKYQIGETYDILVKNSFVKQAFIEDSSVLTLDQINEFIARLDTGYSAKQTKDLFKRMYPKVDFSRQRLQLILLKSL